jgi:hypothetical protein
VRKVVFVTAVLFLSSFAIGRAESLIAHQGFAGPTAYAQSWDDSADADVVNSHTPPPNVSGSYTGMATDHKFGMGEISIDLTQTGSKLSGTWSTVLGGGVTDAPVSGTVKPNSKVHLKLKISHHCSLNFQGTFENGDEISGVYVASGCGHPDHGMADVTD